MKIIESLSYTKIKVALSLDELVREEKKEKNHRGNTSSITEWAKQEKKEEEHKKSLKGRDLDIQDWARDEEKEHEK
jgi:hypothetical protein